ncbi:unnamed protein product [Adineta ricciae]|uniref:Cytochrome P450 n=1 Tax=Adineta ricciae TaxID=249248 RepID=A0A814Y165_ADIRI|nr:unnamed protein product [Adineta ricciae]CAF1377625.1 unnamed protein product [Adineta ricciae]
MKQRLYVDIQSTRVRIIYFYVYSIHYNPDLWGLDDSNLFVPERHTVERHPVAFLAFDVGPRACIEMRFALMEIKMALVHLLQNYTILPGLQIKHGFAIQLEAINIKLIKRH